jgi:outer membrane phospholipase A
MCRPLVLLLIAWSAAGVAHADFLLAPENPTVAPGGRIEVTLFLPNDSAEERSFDLPARLTLRPRGGSGAPEVVIEAIEPRQAQVRLAPGAFHRARYAGTLPEGLVGEIVLEPVDFKGPPLAFSTGTPDLSHSGEPPPSAAAQATPAQEAPAPAAPLDPDAARFASAFSPYEPNYFSAGSRGPTNARYQVSLKFRFFNPNTKTPFLEKIFLSYSQNSIWDLDSSSKPFRDSSYRPSLFFLDDTVSQWTFRGTKLGFQGGFEHESNGKDGTSSRSINTAFVRPTLTFPLEGNYFISVSPKIYGYLDKEENPDISEYRGYVDLLLKIGETDGLQLASTLRKGTRSDAYSVQLDASYPLKKPTFGNLGGYLHLQYFNGYGESLIDYSRHVRPQFRIGLMITR